MRYFWKGRSRTHLSKLKLLALKLNFTSMTQLLQLVASLIIRKNSQSFEVHQTLKRCLSSCPNYSGIQKWQTINLLH